MMKQQMKGVCFLHSETGTEGGWRAVPRGMIYPSPRK
jgi:hypothetical protein